MQGAEAVRLNRKEQNFLHLLSWMENTIYLDKVFVLDINLQEYGAALYGNQEDVNLFKEDYEHLVDYIEECEDY